jgi:hypothetical protein
VAVPADVRTFLDELPKDALVLDVGGWASSDPRADWVIDIGTWETRGYYAGQLGAENTTDSQRVTRETWVVRDISDPEPWPFDAKMFDYVICSHTLEDIRDPVRVCREIARVGKAGYIETPGGAIEVTRLSRSKATDLRFSSSRITSTARSGPPYRRRDCCDPRPRPIFRSAGRMRSRLRKTYAWTSGSSTDICAVSRERPSDGRRPGPQPGMSRRSHGRLTGVSVQPPASLHAE